MADSFSFHLFLSPFALGESNSPLILNRSSAGCQSDGFSEGNTPPSFVYID